jgi:hypothetical protein
MLLKYFTFENLDEHDSELLFETYSFFDLFPVNSCDVTLSINQHSLTHQITVSLFLDYVFEGVFTMSDEEIKTMVTHVEKYLKTNS